MTFNSRGYDGSVTKAVTVQTNDPKDPTVRLTLTGRVTADVVVTPRHVNFEDIRRAEPRKPAKLEVVCKKSVHIEEVRSETPGVIVIRVKEDDDGATYSVSLAKDVPLGRVTGEILIRTTSKKNPLVKVPVYGVIR